jgi:hypothetical protein
MSRLHTLTHVVVPEHIWFCSSRVQNHLAYFEDGRWQEPHGGVDLDNYGYWLPEYNRQHNPELPPCPECRHEAEMRNIPLP